jgi:hypothetical protein
MTLAQGLSKDRASAQDLGITFEVNGEKFGFFIAASTLRSKKRSDLLKVIAEGEGSPVACAICCAQKAGSALCYVRCLDDGKCCDSGATNCE